MRIRAWDHARLAKDKRSPEQVRAEALRRKGKPLLREARKAKQRGGKR
jgi:hypothetical protein